MAWELSVNGTTLEVLTGDTVRIVLQRNVSTIEIPLTDEVWAMDMVSTPTTIRLSGEVADGEGGKSLSQWLSDFQALMPSEQFSDSNYLKIKDAGGNIIASFTPVVLESVEVSLSSSNPTVLNYNIQVRAVTVIQ